MGTHKGRKQGQITWDKTKEIVWKTRSQVRKAKGLAELNLARNMEDSRKGFYRYVRE